MACHGVAYNLVGHACGANWGMPWHLHCGGAQPTKLGTQRPQNEILIKLGHTRGGCKVGVGGCHLSLGGDAPPHHAHSHHGVCCGPPHAFGPMFCPSTMSCHLGTKLNFNGIHFGGWLWRCANRCKWGGVLGSPPTWIAPQGSRQCGHVASQCNANMLASTCMQAPSVGCCCPTDRDSLVRLKRMPKQPKH